MADLDVTRTGTHVLSGQAAFFRFVPNRNVIAREDVHIDQFITSQQVIYTTVDPIETFGINCSGGESRQIG